MKTTKAMKRFWTLNRHHAEGFTLVELIVVIAILAILGGVAVPAYSGYVAKSNKTADQTLIRDVKQALELYAYSNPNSVSTIGVVLSQEGTAPVAKGDDAQQAQVGEALAAVFGDVDSIGLKYKDWKGDSSATSYAQSSYYGKESELIGTVDNLTSALGKVVAEQKANGNDLMGGQFTDFLKNKGVDVDSEKGVGNAAVLYVAENTSKADPETIQNAFTTGINNALASGGDSTRVAEAVFTQLQKELGNVGAMAAIYAYAEGYAQYSGQADIFHAGDNKFTNVSDVNTAVTALGESFKSLENPADPEKSFVRYVQEGQGTKDLQGYIGMMGTIHNNQDIVSGNLGAQDCFTDGTVESMLKGHVAMADLEVTTNDGQVAVIVYIDADGMICSHVTPMNWNK